MRASIVMGVLMTYAFGIFVAMVIGGGPSEILSFSFTFFVCYWGAIFGCLAGLLIAGVLLVSDKLTDAYHRRFPRKDEEP
jgi:hypothetical protein